MTITLDEFNALADMARRERLIMTAEIARLRAALSKAEWERDRALEKWRIGGAMVERAEAELAAARERLDESKLAVLVGWALCKHSEGAGPGKCDLPSCACGPEGVAVAKAICALLERTATPDTKMAPKGQ